MRRLAGAERCRDNVGIYKWEFVLNTPGGGGGRGGAPSANSAATLPGGPPAAVNQYLERRCHAAAVEEQLGLLMTLQNVPVEVLVVDRVEKPSPN